MSWITQLILIFDLDQFLCMMPVKRCDSKISQIDSSYVFLIIGLVCEECGEAAHCITDEDLSSATYYFCVCPEGFVGDAHQECKPEIMMEACEKCGKYPHNYFGCDLINQSKLSHSIGSEAQCITEDKESSTYSCVCPEHFVGDPYNGCFPELVTFSAQSSGWW